MSSGHALAVAASAVQSRRRREQLLHPRADKHFLPPKGTIWKWEGSKRLAVVSDDSNAGFNAVARAWKDNVEAADVEAIKGTCSFHGSTVWIRKNRSSFRDHARNSARVQVDFNRYKCFPFEDLLPDLQTKMLKKWKNTYRETKMADSWQKSWGGKRLTRIEMNSGNPWGGGIPADNNALERSHRDDKAAFSHRRLRPVKFLPQLAHRVALRSKGDLQYCKAMKPMVNSGKFYGRVHAILKREKFNIAARGKKKTGVYKANCQSLRFKYSCPQKNISVGSEIVVSGTGIVELPRVFLKGKMIKNQDDLLYEYKWKDAIRFPTESHSSLLDQYKLLIEKPADAASTFKTFDSIVQLSSWFLLMQPMDPSQSREMREAVTSLHGLLKNDGVPMISCDDLITRNKEGFKKCSCPCWLHYGFCKHSCADAMNRGIILGFPEKRNPRMVSRKKVGRPGSMGIGINAALSKPLTDDETSEASDDGSISVGEDIALDADDEASDSGQ